MSEKFIDHDWDKVRDRYYEEDVEPSYMTLYSIDWLGNFDLNKSSKNTSALYADKLTPYKKYITDIMSEFNGLIWFIAIPISSFIWWYQTRKMKKYKKENMEYFV